MNKRLPVSSNVTYQVSSSARHSCRMCAHGCRNYDVMLTQQEARRLSLGMWRDLLEDIPEDMPLVVLDTTTGQYTLNKRVDGRCVFLGSDNLCIIHKESGLEVKPTACQFFPLHAVQAPDGIHVSLNVGCRRLIEMNEADAPLSEDEAVRLLSGVEAVTTIEEVVPLTPELDITYAEFVGWQNKLLEILTTSQPDYWQNLRQAASLLLTIPADEPAPGINWQTLFCSLHDLVLHRTPERHSTTALLKRIQQWLPALTAQGVVLHGGMADKGDFFAAIARQYLEGRQVGLYRTARSGWVALLTSIAAAMIASPFVLQQSPDANPDHVVNAILSDALDLFFVPLGQIALTEPNQQAFLQGLSGTT